MSNSVYPVLPGLQWPLGRSPRWSTKRRSSASGRRFATSYWTYPIWTYRYSYEFLRRSPTLAEMESLVGFFNSMRGSFDTFLFSDPDDNAVSALQFGTGDGTTVDFPLLRTIGSASEPIGARNGTPTITVNGVTQTIVTNYSYVDDRIVRFVTAPAASAVIRWTGSYFQRCVFVEDEMSAEKFMDGFWSADGVEFETWKA